MFSNSDLKKMILPLFTEQLLVMLVGIADSFVISYAGEAAVSGVSLVNSFNTIFIYLFTALASGGAVIISQYVGKQNMEMAGKAASQLLLASAVFSVLAAALILPFCVQLMGLMFGRVEPDVMDACIVYLEISVYSYPAIAVYNAGAALYRSIGKTSITMYISIAANLINIFGNLYGVFVLKAGVAGVAVPSLLARMFSAAVITVPCFLKSNPVRYRAEWIFHIDRELMRHILRIAVPNGLENGIFQFVKVALSSIVALFGTYQIAANGIAQSIWGMAALIGVAMGPVFITVIGQCMGAGDIPAARLYFKKLLKVTVLYSTAWNVLVLAVTPLLLIAFDLPGKTKSLIVVLVLIHNVFNSAAFPLSGPFSNGLRAAGDIKFTMAVSIASTIGGRLVLSVFWGIVLNLGVIGIAWAMCMDWVIRAVVFWMRFQSGKWEKFQVI